jgi:hypothetical protein
MKQSELDYKQETGLASSQVQKVYDFDIEGTFNYETVYTDEYIEWLEEKYEAFLNLQKEHHESWKDEYDDAAYEIRELESKIQDLQDELNDR